jgi:small GTP-binding protein
MVDGEFRVEVHKNEAGSEGKIVVVRRNLTMSKFKKIAGKKLGVKAKKVFLQTGSEICDVDEMQNNDTLYISQGEPFFKAPAGQSTGGHETLHVSVLGSGGVGKSALTLRFVRDFFVQDWDPTIEDAYRKTVDVDGKLCMLEILDTAGQDDFESLRPQWMMDKDGYIFVYSMDSAQSLEELVPFFDLHQQINENRNVPIVLVANKKDLAESGQAGIVSQEVGMRKAAEMGATYIETSAFTGENVVEAFDTFIREVRKVKNPVKPTGFSWSKCSIL